MLSNLTMRRLGLLLSVALAGGVLAAVVASAGAATQTVTLGSTSGKPTQNICVAGFNCTYVPFHLNLSSPELQVPFDGTVTSFSVNSGSSTNQIELRVLRPAGNGTYTGAGTSRAEKLNNAGVNTFTVSLPVKAGDVLGLDNADSAIVFDTTDDTYITAYYQPALADGATAAPNNTRNGYRLLLSATVRASTTTTTTSSGGNPPPPTGLALSQVAQSHRVWREGNKLAKFSRARKAPVGTTYSFRLSQAARVRFAFMQLVPGRSVRGRCVAPSPHNRSHRRCARGVARGALSFGATSGAHRLSFQGRMSRHRRLPSGHYKLVITATATNGRQSAARRLSFTIV